MTLCRLIESNEDFQEANCFHPKIRIMSAQQNFLIYVGKFLPTNTVSQSNRQHSLLHISRQNQRTQQQALHNDKGIVRSRNTFHLSYWVTVQTHSEKAVCTKHGMWLRLNTATTALSRMLAMFKHVYMNFNFTRICSLEKPQIYSYFIRTQFVQCNDLLLYSVGN
jgi:hypothetical protein